MQFVTTLVTLAAAFGLGVNALPASEIGRVNSFEGTCREMSTSWTGWLTLGAECQEEDGNYASSFLNLNLCIANQAGNMVATPHGGATSSCKDFDLTTDTVLRASCGDGKGGWTDTQVRLSDFVFNKNGALRCFDLFGETYKNGE
ncbi:Cyanovirin-N [Xylariaceae sp. FL1272]|nr:Cyanovirin-N [Xylariaceae sp. FL1272]